MNCPFVADEVDASIKRCPRCKREIRSEHPPEKCYATCKVRGLGDYVAMGLGAFGIKKKAKCGCAKRQAILNRVGAKLGM